MTQLLGLWIEPTIAMRRGEQMVFQCSWCGTVVVQSSVSAIEVTIGQLGACPSCGREAGWWQQHLPVAGLCEASA